jgi:tripeptide aminopeptidase
MDGFGYVYATLPSNSVKEASAPVICFCAHMDTSPDCSGTGVRPIIHSRYDGEDLVLPDDPGQRITVQEHPYLKEKIGEDIITASGTTLLGADDKAGVAVIMDMVHYLLSHPECRHGRIRILFTPDEEIGRGVDKLDMKKLGADFGYTLDGGELGSFEDETFSADGVKIVLHGVSAHPGYAKDKLVNAIKMAGALLESLPKDEWSPETTEGRYGFVHPVRASGTAEKMTIEFIIRDFFTVRLQAYEAALRNRLDEVLESFPGARAEFEVTEQYRNMKEVLEKHPQVSDYAREAIRRAGIVLRESAARGGTDGSRLSFMGLPCPNIFTGEMAFHGKHEYVSVQDMEKSLETLVNLCGIWEEKAGEA